MAGRQRTTFAKLQKERARQEKQAAKRARRQGLAPEPVIQDDGPPVDINDPSTWRYADEIAAEKEAPAETADDAHAVQGDVKDEAKAEATPEA